MSVNFINNNDAFMSNDLKQSLKNEKSALDVNAEQVKLTGNILSKASPSETKIVAESKPVAEPKRIAELQKVGEEKERANDISQKELEEETAIVSEAMKTISEFINMPVRTVNFTQDDGSEKTVIKIYDSENNELIKQFPSEEILSIAQKIIELREDVSKKTGILLDESI